MRDAKGRSSFFVEADRGTMTLERFTRKLKAYAAYFRQKKHEEKFGITLFGYSRLLQAPSASEIFSVRLKQPRTSVASRECSFSRQRINPRSRGRKPYLKRFGLFLPPWSRMRSSERLRPKIQTMRRASRCSDRGSAGDTHGKRTRSVPAD